MTQRSRPTVEQLEEYILDIHQQMMALRETINLLRKKLETLEEEIKFLKAKDWP